MYSESTVVEALSPRSLELILLPTEKCNFRCTYCYEDFAIGRMSRSVIDSIKALIANRAPDLDVLSLQWFGGEPLLARDIVAEISGFAQKVAADNNVTFFGSFTTNGYLLTPEVARQMFDLNQLHYQVSLDGDEEWHNQTRIQPNRKPTFERIWANLVALKAFDDAFNITLRVHVHGDNIESVKRLFARIEETFGDDSRFQVYFHKVSNLSSKTKVSETVLNDADYSAALAYISGEGAELHGRPKSEIHLEDYICYAAKPNSLMIRATGTVGKCTVALDDDRNSIGRILPGGVLEIDNPKLRQWMLGFMDLSKPTLQCPLATLPKSIDQSPLAIRLVTDEPVSA